MRTVAILLALCLMHCAGHPPGPQQVPRSFSLKEFRQLLADQDSLHGAKQYVIGVPRDVWLPAALAAWFHAMDVKNMRSAGRIASLFSLPKSLFVAAYRGAMRLNAYADAIDIACGYGTDVERKRDVVDAVIRRAKTLPQETVFRLKYAECPLAQKEAEVVIALALENLRKDIAADLILAHVPDADSHQDWVRNVLNADLDASSLAIKSDGVKGCMLGLGLADALGFKAKDYAAVISEQSCRDATDLLPEEASKLSPAAARMVFDASKKAWNFRLALFTFHAARGTRAEADLIIAAAFEANREEDIISAGELRYGRNAKGQLVTAVVPVSVLDYPAHAAMLRGRVASHALRIGRVKTAVVVDGSREGVARAFSRALELGKYEDAAEVATQSDDPSMANQGPRDAFYAAMKAGHFAAGNRLRIRYHIPYATYLAAREMYDVRMRIVKRHARCTPTADWSVNPCK